MNLPYGYKVEEKYAGKRLYQDVEVYRPKGEHEKVAQVQPYPRHVASFTKEAKAKDVERVAMKDHKSQAPNLTPEERRARMQDLVSEFWLTEARV